MVEEEQRAKDEVREALTRAERKSSELNSELDETRTSLEQVLGPATFYRLSSRLPDLVSIE